jgi:hypothetical protein
MNSLVTLHKINSVGQKKYNLPLPTKLTSLPTGSVTSLYTGLNNNYYIYRCSGNFTINGAGKFYFIIIGAGGRGGNTTTATYAGGGGGGGVTSGTIYQYVTTTYTLNVGSSSGNSTTLTGLQTYTAPGGSSGSLGSAGSAGLANKNLNGIAGVTESGTPSNGSYITLNDVLGLFGALSATNNPAGPVQSGYSISIAYNGGTFTEKSCGGGGESGIDYWNQTGLGTPGTYGGGCGGKSGQTGGCAGRASSGGGGGGDNPNAGNSGGWSGGSGTCIIFFLM